MPRALTAGSAYVPVIPSMTGFQKMVGSQVAAQSAGLAASGRKAGAGYGKGMAAGAGTTLGPALKKSTASASNSIAKPMAAAGRSAGTGMGVAMASGATTAATGRLRDSKGRFIAAGSAAGNATGQGMGTAMRKAGSSAGSGMAAAAGAAAGRSNAIGAGMAAAAGRVAKGGLVAVGVASGLAIMGGVKSAISQENAQRVFSGLYGSGKQATQMMKDLKQVSKGSALSYDSYLKAGQSLAYAGVKGKEAVGTLRNVGKVISAAGGSDENMGRATDAILKMVNAGKVQLDTLQQLSDAGVPILSGLAKHFGTSISNVNKMASEGKIKLSDVMSVMKKGTGDTFQSMIKAGDKADKSFGNTFKRMKDDVTSSIGAALVPLLQKATPLLQRMGKWLEGAIPAGMKAIGDGASTALPYIKDMATALFKGQHGMGPFAVGSPVIQGLLTIRRAVVAAGTAVKGVFLKAFQLLRPHLVTFGQQMAGLWPDVKALASAVGGFLKGAFQGILPILKIVGFVLGAVFVVALKLIPPVLKVVIKALTWLINLLKPFAGIIASALLPLGLFRTGAVLLGKGLFTLGKWLVSLVGKIPGVGLAFRAVGAVAKWLWSGAIKPAWAAITRAFSFLRASATTQGRVLNTVFRTIGKWATWLYAKAIRPAFTWIRTRISAVATWVRDTAGKIFAATFGRIGAAARALYTRGIRPAFQWIVSRIGIVYRWFRDTVGASFSKTFGRIGSAAKSLYTGGIRPAFQWITKRIGSVRDWLRENVLDSFKRTLSLISGAFTATKDAIGKTWSKIKGAIQRPITWVWGKIKGFIGLLNKIPGVDIKIGASKTKAAKAIAKNPQKGMPGRALAAGGSTGSGPLIGGPWRGPTADNVLGVDNRGVARWRVNPREYIHPVDAVRHYGTRAMDLVRQKKAAILPASSVPTYATGGQVGSYFGSLPRYAKGGHTWPLIWNYVRKHFPGVRKTSDYRPGSQSLRKSSHALGTAIDITGSVSAVSKVMRHMLKFAGNMRDLIYTPLWGHSMISDGKKIRTPRFLYNTHKDHGHIGLLPGRSLTGKPVSMGDSGGGFFDLESLLAPAKKFASGIWQGVKSKFGDGFGPQTVVGAAKTAVSGMLSKAGSMASAAFDSGALGALPGMGPIAGAKALWDKLSGKGSVIPKGQRTSLIKAALTAVGLPHSKANISATYNRAWKESRWDAGITQKVRDINSRRGDPAIGLMQIIGSTFRANRDPRLPNDRRNPLASLVAAMRYAMRKYGSITAGFNRRGGYALGGLVKPIPGYARGGVTKPGLSLVGERGPELITTGRQRVYSNSESKQMLGRNDIHITINGIDTDNADEVVKALRFEFNRNGRYVGV